MPSQTKNTNPDQDNAKVMPDPVDVAIKEYDKGVKDKMNAYYQVLLEQLDKEVSIAKRYELKIQIETVVQCFKTVYPNGQEGRMLMAERKPQPGDKDYKGGVTHTSVYANGKGYDVRTVKDENGNPISVTETKKVWGIF